MAISSYTRYRINMEHRQSYGSFARYAKLTKLMWATAPDVIKLLKPFQKVRMYALLAVKTPWWVVLKPLLVGGFSMHRKASGRVDAINEKVTAVDVYEKRAYKLFNFSFWSSHHRWSMAEAEQYVADRK